MTAYSEKELPNDVDFELGIKGFRFSDLFDAYRLKDLADAFYDEVRDKDPTLGEALDAYIRRRGEGIEKRAASNILTDSAPHLSDFIGRLFSISREREVLQRTIVRQNPIWQYKFFVQRRAIKKYGPEKIGELNANGLTEALKELRFAAFDETIPFDEELAIATMAGRLIDAEDELTKGADISTAVRETVAKIGDAYRKLEDKTF